MVRYLRVTVVGGNTGTLPTVNVSVLPTDLPGRSIGRIDEVTQVAGSLPFQLVISNVGQIGQSPSQRATIRAAKIGAVSCIASPGVPGYSGNVYADFVSIGGAPFVTGWEDPLVVQGSLFGSIDCLSLTGDGGVVAPIIVEGVIGDSQYPFSIRARVVRSVLADSFTGTIFTDSIIVPPATQPTDRLCRFETRAGGNVAGTITTSQFQQYFVGSENTNYFRVGGDLDANITIRRQVEPRDGTDPAPITIAGEFKAGRTINIGTNLWGPFSPQNGDNGGIRINAAGGLKGQVIVNSRNDPATTFAFGAPIAVGTTTLAAYVPHYPTLSSTLGGGAVGEVPFNLHKEDCLPANGSGACSYPSRNWISCGSLTTDIRDTLVLRHYGPIVVENSGGNAPVKVERQSLVQQCNPNCTPAPWEDVTSQVDICVAPTEGSTPRPREIWIARKRVNGVAQPWWGGYQIQVSLMPNSTNPYLRSSGTLAANSPIIAGYPYSFGTLCDELLGLSAGGWTNDDIAAWGATPTDLNNDGVADASDLALLVNLVTQTEQGGGWGNPPTE